MKYAELHSLLHLLSDATAMTEAERPVPRLLPIETFDGDGQGAGADDGDSSNSPNDEPFHQQHDEPLLGFQTRALLANNNLLTNVDELPRVLSRLLVNMNKLLSLDLSFNRILHIPPTIGMLPALEVLRLHDNELANIEELAHLRSLTALTRLTLMRNPLVMQRLSSLARHALKHNPFADQMEEEYRPDVYRLRVLARLPQLRQLDVMAVTDKERLEASRTAANGATARVKSRPHPRDMAALAGLWRDAKSDAEKPRKRSPYKFVEAGRPGA